MNILGLHIGTEVLGWVGGLLGIAVGGSILSFILKRFVTDSHIATWQAKISQLGYGCGVAVTLGLSKWKYTKKIWNTAIEPYVLLLVDVLSRSFINGFINGLKSDNPDTRQ